MSQTKSRFYVEPDKPWTCPLCFTKVNGDRARKEHNTKVHGAPFGRGEYPMKRSMTARKRKYVV